MDGDCRLAEAFWGLDGQAAVDADDLSGNVAGLVGAEEGDDSSYIFGDAETVHGDAVKDHLLQVVGKFFDHAGEDVAWGEGVGGDVTTGDFFGDGLGEADEGGFGGGIVGLTGVAGDSHDGGHVDDASASLSDHEGQDGLGAEEGASEVHVDRFVPFPSSHAHQKTVFAYAGVIDEDIDAAPLLADLGDHGLDLSFFGNIGLQGEGLATLGGDFVNELLGGSFAGVVVDGDFDAFGGEAEGDGASNAPGGASDEGYVAFKIRGHSGVLR